MDVCVCVCVCVCVSCACTLRVWTPHAGFEIASTFQHCTRMLKSWEWPGDESRFEITFNR